MHVDRAGPAFPVEARGLVGPGHTYFSLKTVLHHLKPHDH